MSVTPKSRLLAPAIKAAISLLSPAGPKARLSILIYHRVVPEPDPFCPAEVDRATFRWQMEVVSSLFTVLPLPEAITRLESADLPARSMSITFDDGYADNVSVALPILKEFELSATFFIATGFLDGGRMWNDTVIEAIRNTSKRQLELQDLELGHFALESLADRRTAIAAILRRIKHLPLEKRQSVVDEIAERAGEELPTDLMMRREDVRMLSNAGMDLGGHTVNHPILTSLSHSGAIAEIEGGRAELEAICGHQIDLFAYPNGRRDRDYSAEHVELVRELGFRGAVSTNPGITRNTDSLFEMCRFTPWDDTPSRFLARLMLNCVNRAA